MPKVMTWSLWSVIYLTVGWLFNAASEAQDDTPGMTFCMTYLWPLPVFTITLIHVWSWTVAVIDWVCEKAGYIWKE